MLNNKVNSNVNNKQDAPKARPAPIGWQNWIGVLPFFIFAFLFIFLPSAALLIGAFQGADGKFTFSNFIGLFEPSILASYWVTIRISLVTAFGG
ncbi:MAG: hypothetical protein WCP19_16345, partial [Chloroflexota bacterium]